MVYTRAFLHELSTLSDAQLREIGVNRLCLDYSLQEIEETLTSLTKTIIKRKQS